MIYRGRGKINQALQVEAALAAGLRVLVCKPEGCEVRKRYGHLESVESYPEGHMFGHELTGIIWDDDLR